MYTRPVVRSDGYEYISLAEAAKMNQTCSANIIHAIRRNGTAGGFHWKYKEGKKCICGHATLDQEANYCSRCGKHYSENAN